MVARRRARARACRYAARSDDADPNAPQLNCDADPCPLPGYACNLSALRQLSVYVPAAGMTLILTPVSTRLADCILRIALASIASLRALWIDARMHVHTHDVDAIVRLLGPRLELFTVRLVAWVLAGGLADETARLDAIVRRALTRPDARICCAMPGRSAEAWCDPDHVPPTEEQRLRSGADPGIRTMRGRGDSELRAYCARRSAWIAHALRTSGLHSVSGGSGISDIFDPAWNSFFRR